MLLPDAAKKRFDAYAQNGQSAILQVVKDSIRETYATSDIRADGQVVKIFFVNGMKFEVVPAFKNRWPAREVVPEKLRTLDHGRPWSDDQFASTRLSSNRDMSR